MDYDKILAIKPFALDQSDKDKIFTSYLKELTIHHMKCSSSYANILNGLSYSSDEVKSVTDIPFLPVSLFKQIELKSASNEDVFKTMTSSGTTGQQVSKIFLDKKTAVNQQKTLAKIMSEFLGKDRLPMIIIDSPSVIKDRTMFSARGAGILGFSIFGSKKIYALNDDMSLNIDALRNFINEHQHSKILIFGFTFMIWQHFYHELVKNNITLNLQNAVLFHGGGWKKLSSQNITSKQFKEGLFKTCKLESIHDYYGMVEQTGCIYVECEYGHLHASSYSDIIIRNPNDFSELGINKIGIIQVLSLLPESYPGHSLLTEDEGVLLGIDDCKCGRKGKYFKVLGRLQNAEIRGCSDTYETQIKRD